MYFNRPQVVQHVSSFELVFIYICRLSHFFLAGMSAVERCMALALQHHIDCANHLHTVISYTFKSGGNELAFRGHS